MIDKRLVPYGGLKKEPFSGSHNGMRYMMRSDNGKESTTFTVFIYPEPWCFEQTPEDQIERKTLNFLKQDLILQSLGYGKDLKLNRNVGNRHYRK